MRRTRLNGAAHAAEACVLQATLLAGSTVAEASQVTGVVLTKLDGTARGGIALAIARELGLPVKLIGVGESVEDLRPFDAEDFARVLIDQG